jgi:hypothetical protein
MKCLPNLALFWFKNANSLAKLHILKIITSVPGHPACGHCYNNVDDVERVHWNAVPSDAAINLHPTL